MQKFTLFTIIVAVIVLSVTAELITHNYLEELYPKVASTNLLGNLDDLDGTNGDNSSTEFDQNEDNPDQPPATSENTSEETTVEADTDTENSPAIDLKLSDKIVSLLPSIDISNLKYVAKNYGGQLFDVIATDVNPDTVAYAELVVASGGTNNVIGTAYEFELKDQREARRLYTDIKQKATAISEIDVNETNQFGQSSFYINHRAKVNEVFTVVTVTNFVYAFAYDKELHESFKPFFGLLSEN